MKLYTNQTAPSPRRVRMFIAEKGLDVPMEEVDLRSGEHLSADYRQKNPQHTVPTLELDDGTCIHESDAICVYLDALHPEPPVMGADPKSRGLIRMWDRRVEFDGFLAVAEGFRNRVKGLKDRALPGPHKIAQIPELAERGVYRYGLFLDDLNERLGRSAYVAGETFSIADITAFVTVEFARTAIKVEPGDHHGHLLRWHESVSARPSASA